ncbi:hypothetical protein EI94DRAFT_1857550 [Lactarius quietus]|nr:hypothetical protein EI94DRAFT_1857550 [Lactarius quietus]
MYQYQLLCHIRTFIVSGDSVWTENKSKEEEESGSHDRMKSEDAGARFAHCVPMRALVFPAVLNNNAYQPSQLLTILRAVIVTFYWVMVKLVVSPVEGLLRINGWWAELRLTAGLTFSTIKCGKVFNCAIPMRIRFPREVPAHVVVAQIMDMDASERDFCEWRKEQGQANALLLSGSGDAELYSGDAELYSDKAEKERRAAVVVVIELSSDGDESEKERSALHTVPVVQRIVGKKVESETLSSTVGPLPLLDTPSALPLPDCLYGPLHRLHQDLDQPSAQGKQWWPLEGCPYGQSRDQSVGTQQQASKGLPQLGGPHNGGASSPGAFGPAMVLGRLLREPWREDGEGEVGDGEGGCFGVCRSGIETVLTFGLTVASSTYLHGSPQELPRHYMCPATLVGSTIPLHFSHLCDIPPLKTLTETEMLGHSDTQMLKPTDAQTDAQTLRYNTKKGGQMKLGVVIKVES